MSNSRNHFSRVVLSGVTCTALALAACGQDTAGAGVDEAAVTGVASQASQAPAYSLSETPKYPVAHEVTLVESSTHTARPGEVLAVCEIKEGGQFVRTQAEGFNPIFPTDAASITLTNTAPYDVLLQSYERDEKAPNSVQFVEPTLDDAALRYPAVDFPSTSAPSQHIAILKPGQSLAINVPAHERPTLPRLVTLKVKCQPRSTFEQNPVGRFHYGGDTSWDFVSAR